MASRKARTTQPETIEMPDPAEVERRMKEMGMPMDVALTALRRGQNARDFCTAAHPRTFPGNNAWAETNAGIREAQGAKGWTLDDEDNIPKVISPDKSIVITALSGNERTGLRDRERPASTRHPRREAGMRIVLRNMQLELLEESQPPHKSGANDGKPVAFGPTWFLLYYRDKDIIRSELSLAVEVSNTGVLKKWSERLILPEINMLDGNPQKDTGTETLKEVDVPVERRVG
jgi:hypothetical protein